MLSSFDNDTKIYGATNHHSGVRITGREIRNEYVDGLTIFQSCKTVPHIILFCPFITQAFKSQSKVMKKGRLTR
jgi:hypothetical protein